MRHHTTALAALAVLAWLALAAGWAAALDYPGPPPGAARARLEHDRLVFENEALVAEWSLPGTAAGFRLREFGDRRTAVTIGAGPHEPLVLGLADGRTLPASALTLVGKPTLHPLAPDPKSVRLAERLAGWKATIELASADGSVRLVWQAVLRDQSNYVRIEARLCGEGKALVPDTLTLVDVVAPGAASEGVVDGSPVVAGTVFLGVEHPLAANRVERGRVRCAIKLGQTLQPGRELARTAVLGVVPKGQARRAFAYYLERERARPFQPFLHYNSWYDIAWGDRKMDERQCLDVIAEYGRELVERRRGVLDSLVFDDGWDDNKTLWRFHSGFPRGFTPLRAAAQKHHTSVGVWLSPWGGYGEAKKQRMEFGRKEGFETNRNGFSLAGPKYYARFRDVCAEMVEKHGVNYFKFDGIAQGLASAGAGAEYAGDVEGLLRLIADLRRLRPDLFVNVTTGTWPSPFWLLWCDSIWRNGNDMGFFGPGSKRQQWITYRDMIECQWIVRRAPLYPISSLMTQGIAQARLGHASELGSDLAEWKSEVRSFFASGTQLQELYVTPTLLTAAMWDVLAEAAAWSRKNADVLVDVHWIGGDPGKGEAYGFAAWQPRQAMLALRNPSDKPGSLVVEVSRAFELPPGAPQEYRLACPWGDAPPAAPRVLRAGQPHRFELAPFEVLVFDALPGR